MELLIEPSNSVSLRPGLKYGQTDILSYQRELLIGPIVSLSLHASVLTII